MKERWRGCFWNCFRYYWRWFPKPFHPSLLCLQFSIWSCILNLPSRNLIRNNSRRASATMTLLGNKLIHARLSFIFFCCHVLINLDCFVPCQLVSIDHDNRKEIRHRNEFNFQLIFVVISCYNNLVAKRIKQERNEEKHGITVHFITQVFSDVNFLKWYHLLGYRSDKIPQQALQMNSPAVYLDSVSNKKYAPVLFIAKHSKHSVNFINHCVIYRGTVISLIIINYLTTWQGTPVAK